MVGKEIRAVTRAPGSAAAASQRHLKPRLPGMDREIHQNPVASTARLAKANEKFAQRDSAAKTELAARPFTGGVSRNGIDAMAAIAHTRNAAPIPYPRASVKKSATNGL